MYSGLEDTGGCLGTFGEVESRGTVDLLSWNSYGDRDVLRYDQRYGEAPSGMVL